MDLNELQSLHIRELTELAQKLNIEGSIAGLNKQELTVRICLLYTSPRPRDATLSRMPSSA